MYHIAEALVRWLAPITSFTAEEVWACLPGEHSDSVFFETWYDAWAGIKTNLDQWQTLIGVRDEVNKLLEAERNDGKIRSALDANITLFAAGDLLETLQNLGDELRFVLITSGANVLSLKERSPCAKETAITDLVVEIEVTTAEKCARCWQRCSDVGEHQNHPELCGRCIDNISTDAGECRCHA
jgi:isoleucyl-tRNA synthetase